MSRYIATSAIRGANNIVRETDALLQQALKEKSADTKVGFPNTAYFLPTILGLRNDDGRLAAALSRRPGSRRALSRAAALIDERGGISRARELAQRYTERSLRELAGLPHGEPRSVLEHVAEKLAHRTR